MPAAVEAAVAKALAPAAGGPVRDRRSVRVGLTRAGEPAGPALARDRGRATDGFARVGSPAARLASPRSRRIHSGLGPLFAWHRNRAASATRTRRVIAVLPFENARRLGRRLLRRRDGRRGPREAGQAARAPGDRARAARPSTGRRPRRCRRSGASWARSTSSRPRCAGQKAAAGTSRVRVSPGADADRRTGRDHRVAAAVRRGADRRLPGAGGHFASGWRRRSTSRSAPSSTGSSPSGRPGPRRVRLLPARAERGGRRHPHAPAPVSAAGAGRGRGPGIRRGVAQPVARVRAALHECHTRSGNRRARAACRGARARARPRRCARPRRNGHVLRVDQEGLPGCRAQRPEEPRRFAE